MGYRFTIMGAAALSLAMGIHGGASANSINAGDRPENPKKPFTTQTIASFNTPWAIAFLPNGRLLVTEKPGKMFAVTQDGRKSAVANVPDVAASGQNGLLDIAVAPDFRTSSKIYFTYVEPDRDGGTLVLSQALLRDTGTAASLEDLKVLWRQTPAGGRGQPGGIIAFDPSGRHLFLTVGDRMEPETAQDPKQARGKVLRLNLDGSIPSDNPKAAKGGVEGETWTTGHRNPYGLAFAPDGRLWLNEMGPRGGDELNLIEKNNNYGWPVVSNGDNYNGTSIPRHAMRPEFAAPDVYWTPVIAPAGMAFYEGAMFPQWRGSALIGGLKVRALVRIAFNAKGEPDEAERWDMNARIRDMAVASDGSVWVIEDATSGKLMRLTPAKS